MKNLFAVVIAGLFVFSVQANNLYVVNNVLRETLNDSAKQSSLAPLLTLYYDLKNALVNGDAATAASKAAGFLKAVNGVDMKVLSAGEHTAFMPLQNKLGFDARHISEVRDISHQREHFASLSLNMYTLAKGAKLSGQAIYEDYCPMKKAYWLSSEAAIKNPYFGNEMPTCGQVKETLQ
jgi:hypothetical protein